VLIFAAVLVLGAITGAVLSKLLRWAGLSWVDRILGGLFGVVRGLVLSVALVLALMAFPRHAPPRAVVESRLAPYVIGVAHACAQIAPNEVREGVEESYAKAREAWDAVLDNTRKAGRKRGSAVLR
jgi:membrane protein required for colicin V production